MSTEKSESDLTAMLEKVKEFHRVFEVPYRNAPGIQLSAREAELRHKLMKEENQEYLSAALSGDSVKTADALGDMLYVLLGTVITHGMQDQIVRVFNEIHRSNMSKLDESGKPLRREDGKVIKSDSYSEPDLHSIFNNLGNSYPEK